MIIGYATTQPWYLALFCIIVAVVVALLYRHHLHDKHLHATALAVQPEQGEEEEEDDNCNDVHADDDEYNEDEDFGDNENAEDDDLAEGDCWEVSLGHESLRSGCGSGGDLSQPLFEEAKGWSTGPQHSGGSVGSHSRSLEGDGQK